MRTTRIALVLLLCLAGARLGAATEHVVLLLDGSSEMWSPLGQDDPRFVELRNALYGLAVDTPSTRDKERMVALRTMAGAGKPETADACAETALVLPFGTPEPLEWGRAIADLAPRGRRPLVAAIRAAVHDLKEISGTRRIALVTSGADECHEDVAAAIAELAEADPPIELRIVGLGLDSATATAASAVAGTRNVTDATKLAAALEWAVGLDPRRSSGTRQVQVSVAPPDIGGADAELILETSGDVAAASGRLREGTAHLRVAPGRYDPVLKTEARQVELSGLVIRDQTDNQLSLRLTSGPAVSLAVIPEQPLAGDLVAFEIWGGPARSGWLSVAKRGARLGSYLVRAPAAPGQRLVEIRLPDEPTALDAHFLVDAAPGVLESLGRIEFESEPPVVVVSSAQSAENGTPFRIEWSGEIPSGSEVAIAPAGGPAFDAAVCSMIPTGIGATTVTAPPRPDRYVIYLLSPWDHVLGKQPLEVFEVLATLAAASTAAAGGELEVEWAGPDDPQDFLSIARSDAAGDEYLTWTPTASGAPAHLAIPTHGGRYEVRYVRGLDGAILAKQSLEVVEEELRIEAPDVADPGTRFEVRVTGTPNPGDFVAVARTGADLRDFLDFAFVDSQTTASLAAPFDPGRYEVRYVSAAESRIVASSPLVVR